MNYRIAQLSLIISLLVSTSALSLESIREVPRQSCLPSAHVLKNVAYAVLLAVPAVNFVIIYPDLKDYFLGRGIWKKPFQGDPSVRDFSDQGIGIEIERSYQGFKHTEENTKSASSNPSEAEAAKLPPFDYTKWAVCSWMDGGESSISKLRKGKVAKSDG